MKRKLNVLAYITLISAISLNVYADDLDNIRRELKKPLPIPFLYGDIEHMEEDERSICQWKADNVALQTGSRAEGQKVYNECMRQWEINKAKGRALTAPYQ